MKKRFMLTAAGIAATGFGATVSADTVNWTHELDRWAGEHAWQCMDASGNIVASMFLSGSSLMYNGDGITSLSYVSNTASSIFGTITFNMDMAGGDYHVNMVDTYGDGWAWGTFVGGLYVSGAASGGASFPSGSGASFDFTVSGGGGDPCNSPLSEPCPADVNADGSVDVADVLEVIGSWGQMGDGTFRPIGDCAPLPNGDCTVDVADVLAVVGGWGADCTPPLVYGSCCMADESCLDMTADDCSASNGTYNGDGSECASTSCEVLPGACCFSNDDCLDTLDETGCADFGGAYQGDGTICPDACEAAANDECSGAAVAVVGSQSFDTSLMTPSTPDVTDELCAGTYLDWMNSQDCWFVFTPDADGLASFSLCDGASYDTSLVLYEGDCDTMVACNGDTAGETGCQPYYSAIYDWPVTAGTAYYLRIGGWQAATGSGTLTIAASADIPSACCTGSGCEMLDLAGCAAAGGVFLGSGSLCDDATCYAGCPADSVDEGAPCFVDGDDANSDINGGPLVSPPLYGSITAGVPICGTVSIYMNIDGAGPYRDMDMYLMDGLDSGGVHTFTVGSSGFNMNFGVLELNPAGLDPGLYGVAGAFWVLTGGVEATVDSDDLPPLSGDAYMIGVFPSEWDTSWTCDSGLNEYHITVD